jgi:putative membrane protein
MAHVARAHGAGVPVNAILWTLVSVAVAVNLAGGLLTDVWPPTLLATIITLSLVVFALTHGSITYGVRGITVFAAICLVVSNVIEQVGVVTGIPFGNYHYGDHLGPKLFMVPVLIGPAYFGIAYLAWSLARVTLSAAGLQRSVLIFALPLVASLVMVACNLSYDPLISTVRRGWIWRDGGAYFGVPASNFVGWFVTSYIFFQLFAFYLRKRVSDVASTGLQLRSHWLQPIVLYGSVCAAVILGALVSTTTGVVTDSAGVAWRIRDIYVGCAVVSALTMGSFTLLGLVTITSAMPRRRA